MTDYIGKAKPTVQTDAELVEKINHIMATKQCVTRTMLKNKLCTTHDRLERLERLGLCKIPPKLSKSAGASIARKRNGVGKGWYISRKAEWQ